MGLDRLRLAGLAAVAALLAGALAPGSAQAVVYGLKSTAGDDGKPSKAPTYLFSFAEDGPDFTAIGEVKVGGSSIDADGLAVSGTYGLMGFRLSYTGDVVASSTLISINTGTAVGTPIGSGVSREIRGATFDHSLDLWVVDQASSSILRIDPTTGAEIGGSAVTLKKPDLTPFSLGFLGTDIAVRSDGTFYLVHGQRIYTLDASTGVVTEIKNDGPPPDTVPTQQLAGAAFSEFSSKPDHLFAYEVNGEDDIFRYTLDTGGIPRTTLFTDIISSFNAGRGDLAATPEPTSMLLFGTTLIGLGAAARRAFRRRTD
jgi:hypothetical protein